MGPIWSNTKRGAQFLDGTMRQITGHLGRVADSLHSIAASLEILSGKQKDEIVREALHAALDAEGGRSISIAEMIDDLEREMTKGE